MILALLLAGAATAAESSPRGQAAAFFAAFNRRDFVAMEALYAPDARLVSSDFCAPRGKADIRRTYQKLFDGHPDVRDIVDVMIVEGDRVAIRFRAVSQSGGRTLDLPIMSVLRFDRGLIVEDDTIFDTGGQPCDP